MPRRYRQRRPAKADLSEWFWSRVDKSGECWNWTGALNASGYGLFYKNRRHVFAHRYSLEASLGRELGPQERACHRCDNPACVRGAHLFAGSQADNMRDAWGKGRLARLPPLFGLAHPTAKLGNDDVEALRGLRLMGATVSDIAAVFGISKSYAAQLGGGRLRPWL